MIVKLALAGVLLAHAAIHAGYVSRPPATAGGPAWPFDLAGSWVLGAMGVSSDVARLVGLALVAATAGGFAVAAVAALGVVPETLWAPAAVTGSIASIALLVIFFHPWLVLGLAIDLVILWAVLVARWSPASLAT
jgi:hypothetical protein